MWLSLHTWRKPDWIRWNHCPISNLFLSKVLERLVNFQPHWNGRPQSIFWDCRHDCQRKDNSPFSNQHHSCFCRHRSLHPATGAGATFGFNDIILQWIRTYLQDRIQTVHVNGKFTTIGKWIVATPWVHRGLLLFTQYTADIGDLIRSSGLNHHLYGNFFNQVYSSCLPPEYMVLKTKSSTASTLLANEWQATGLCSTQWSQSLWYATTPRWVLLIR